MDTASLSGFLRTLLIIVLIYYAFKFIMRHLVPILIFRAAKKAGANFQQRQQEFYDKHNNTTQHDTKSDFSQSDKFKEKKKIGEYIEFEELD